MARRSSERKPTLPRVSLGLGNILAQSGVVVDAFGPRLGFVLMMMAILAGAVVTGSAAVLFARLLGRYLGAMNE